MAGKIKVIKKGEVNTVAAPVNKVKVSKREAARDMVSTVSSWVSDLQQKKRNSTKLAIEQLFGQQPRATEG
jgi:phage pi2 protein 07